MDHLHDHSEEQLRRLEDQLENEVYKIVDLIKAKGGKVTKEPGPVKGGNTVITFVEDPDGYKFELLQRGPTPEPLCQVMLRVGDLDRSINFCEKAFGMKLLPKRDNPDYKYMIAMMGYSPEDQNTILELTYNYGVKEYDKGNGYAQWAQTMFTELLKQSNSLVGRLLVSQAPYLVSTPRLLPAWILMVGNQCSLTILILQKSWSDTQAFFFQVCSFHDMTFRPRVSPWRSSIAGKESIWSLSFRG